jgi:hypothetical protein
MESHVVAVPLLVALTGVYGLLPDVNEQMLTRDGGGGRLQSHIRPLVWSAGSVRAMRDHSRTGSQSLHVFSKNGIVTGFTPAADRPLDHHLRVVSARISSDRRRPLLCS